MRLKKKKKAKNLAWPFPKEDVQVVNRHQNKDTQHHDIRKTTLPYHYIQSTTIFYSLTIPSIKKVEQLELG